MQQASTLFTSDLKQRIRDAVAEAEKQTSAEIVPVVATASGRYDRAEDMVGLWFAIFAMTMVWLIYPTPQDETGNWAGTAPFWQWLSLIAALLLAFVAGTALASRIGGLRRLCTPGKQMADEVAGRARAIFFDQRIHHTTGGSGVLIYVSLYERQAAVIADQTVFTKLGQANLDQLCATLTSRLPEGDITAALCETIAETGKKLAECLPRTEGDVNELPDVLVTVDE